MPTPDSPNPAPDSLRTQAFIVREAIALCFVVFWLALFAGELITGSYNVPFWFHCVAVGVLGYALGIDVARLTTFRKPSPVAVAKTVLNKAGEG